jgi:hypothetical protein
MRIVHGILWERHSRKRNSACATRILQGLLGPYVPSRKSRTVQGFFDSDTPDPHHFWHKQRVQKPRHRFVDPAVQSVSALVAARILVSRNIVSNCCRQRCRGVDVHSSVRGNYMIAGTGYCRARSKVLSDTTAASVTAGRGAVSHSPQAVE